MDALPFLSVVNISEVNVQQLLIKAVPFTINLEHVFTLSASSFLSTCPCHLSLHLLITSPIASRHVRLRSCWAVFHGNTTHPPDHPHLSPFYLLIHLCPHSPCLAPIQQAASNACHVNLLCVLIQRSIIDPNTSSYSKSTKHLYDLCNFMCSAQKKYTVEPIDGIPP